MTKPRGKYGEKKKKQFKVECKENRGNYKYLQRIQINKKIK